MKTAAALVALFVFAALAGAQTNPARVDLLPRMERIVIPSMEFREANAGDVLDFLIEATTAPDPDPPGSFGLITPEPNPPRMIHRFETEDGFTPDLPPCDITAHHMPLLQAIDLICGQVGVQYGFGEAGPELYLPDGRRLLPKDVPAPPLQTPPATAPDDEWGFGAGDFGGEIAPRAPDGIDWEPLLRAFDASPAELEGILTKMGFTCTRRKGEFAHFHDPARLPPGLHPLDCIWAERQEGETRWTVRIFIADDGRTHGLAIQPHPGF